MSNGRQIEKPSTYQFRVKGNFSQEWSAWFEGFRFASQAGNETILTGQVKDQAALHGLLARFARIGIPLLEVKRLEYSQKTSEPSSRNEGEKRHE